MSGLLPELENLLQHECLIFVFSEHLDYIIFVLTKLARRIIAVRECCFPTQDRCVETKASFFVGPTRALDLIQSHQVRSLQNFLASYVFDIWNLLPPTARPMLGWVFIFTSPIPIALPAAVPTVSPRPLQACIVTVLASAFGIILARLLIFEMILSGMALG